MFRDVYHIFSALFCDILFVFIQIYFSMFWYFLLYTVNSLCFYFSYLAFYEFLSRTNRLNRSSYGGNAHNSIAFTQNNNSSSSSKNQRELFMLQKYILTDILCY